MVLSSEDDMDMHSGGGLRHRSRRPGRRRAAHASKKTGVWTLLHQHIATSKKTFEARHRRALQRQKRDIKELEELIEQAVAYNQRLDSDISSLKEQNKVFGKKIKQIKELLPSSSNKV